MTVTFAAGSWADTAGSSECGGTSKFNVTDALGTDDVSTPGHPTPSRVFFIEISGQDHARGVRLPRRADARDPGQGLLEIGQVLIGGVNVTRFTLDASGTVKVIKIGNIASGAADFVLGEGRRLRNIEF